MGGTFGKSGSFTIDHSMDHIPMSKMEDENLRHGSITTLSTLSYPSNAGEPISLFESKEEQKKRRRSLMVAYSTMFVMSIGFSIVLTGVWPYMNTLNADLGKEYVGWVVAANPLGQVLASPLLGIWGNKAGGIRIPCLVTVIFFILGNAMYSLLPAFEGMGKMASYYAMIVSRFIVGVSSANVTLTRAYVASGTTLKERTIGISIIAASQALGFVVGPVIQAVLTAAIPGDGDTGISWLRWDKYTSCSWVAAALGLINLVILTPCVFKEYNIAAKEMALLKTGDDDIKLPKPDPVGIGGILFCNFISLFIFTLIETLAEPLVQDEYGWSDETALVVVGIALAGGGLVSVGMFSLSGVLCRKFDERKVILFLGFPLLVLGSFLFIPFAGGFMSQQCPEVENVTTIAPSSTISSMFYNLEGETFFLPDNDDYVRIASTPDPEDCSEDGCPYDEQTWCATVPQIPLPQLGIAFFVIMCGYPFCQSISQAIYSKMLGPKPQGLWMGILTGVGGLSRIIGPIFVSNVYTFYGTYITFGVLTVAMVLAIIDVSILYKRLVPMKVPSKSEMHGHDGPAANDKF